MKKILALFSLFSLLTAFTCENEPLEGGFDTAFNNNNEGLIGTWNLLEFDVSVSTSTSFEGENISSEIDIFSTNTAYVLEFNENTFTTNGSYSYNADVVVNGDNVANDIYTLNNVAGNGIYSTNGNEMTIDGSFFEFNFEGMDSSVLEGEQTANFEISNDGETLTFTQDETETQTDETTGTVITSTTSSTSVWIRGEVSDTCSAQSATDEAAAAYNEDDTNQDLCNAYRTTLENQIAECGDTDGSIQAIINDLGNCEFGNQGEPGTLKVRVGTLDVDFVTQNISLENGLINVEGTSAGGGYMVSFQIDEGATGIDIFQNFVLTLNGTEFFPSTQGVDDFTSETTVSSQGILIATFFGLVESAEGADLSLTQGMVEVDY